MISDDDDEEVIDGQAELPLVLVGPPQIVEGLFGDHSPSSILRLAGVDRKLRVVHSHGGGNDVLRGERLVDNHAVMP